MLSKQAPVRLLSSCHTSPQAARRIMITSCLSAQHGTMDPQLPTRTSRYAIIGAGLAGMATAWHLLKLASTEHRMEVDMYDVTGIAAGASGAAAGLLHPFTPKGKVLWRGLEAMSAAMELLQAAEEAASVPCVEPSGAQPAQQQQQQQQFVWRHGMVRIASDPKQAHAFLKACSKQPSMPGMPHPHDSSEISTAGFMAECVSMDRLQQLLPGLQACDWMMSPSAQAATAGVAEPSSSSPCPDRQQQDLAVAHASSAASSHHHPQAPCTATDSSNSSTSSSTGSTGSGSRSQGNSHGSSQRNNQRQQKLDVAELALSCAGLHIPGGIVLDVPKYLQAVWRACQAQAASLGNGSAARLHTGEAVVSLEELQCSQGPYDGILVAAGAACGTIRELQDKLPLQLCQGYTLIMEPLQPFPSGLTSLLGQPYMALQGPNQAVVGATKSYGWSPQDALRMCKPAHSSMRWDAPAELSKLRSAYQGPQSHTTGPCSSSSSGHISSSSGNTGGSMNTGNTSCLGVVDTNIMNTPSTAASTCFFQGGNSHVHALTSQESSSDALLRDACWPDEVVAAVSELLPACTDRWPAIAACKVKEIKSGVRALPPRTPAGSVPLVGKINIDRTWWVCTGLGARGLVYHAWLGKLVASAMTSQGSSSSSGNCGSGGSSSSSNVPVELTQWQFLEKNCV